MADFHSADFAADGFGEFAHELNHARVFVGGGGALHKVLNVLHQRWHLLATVFHIVFNAWGVGKFLAEHHGGFHCHTTHLVGHASHGALHHSLVLHQRIFHLEWTNAIARRLDYIVFAAHKPIVAVFVTPSDVASVVNAVVEILVGEFWVAVVAEEQSFGAATVGAYDDFALLTVFSHLSIGGDEVDVVARIWLAH